MDMNIDMGALTGLVALVVGLVEVAKQLELPSKYAPLTALLLGVGGAFMIAAPELSIGEVVYTGIVIGLTASGLYSSGKSTSKTIKGLK